MKILSVKFSDERSKKYSIKTTILEDIKKFVVKEAVYPEGEEHIQNIFANKDLLAKTYSGVQICPCELDANKLAFDFIKGESLQNKYLKCVENGDKTRFEELLNIHKALVIGSDDNVTKFQETDSYNTIFGDGKAFVGAKALKISNYDAIASNIIYVENQPCFIDYEWVYDFSVPLDVVLYHCVVDMYLHHDIECFYPVEEAMRFLGVEIDLELLKASYENFFHYVIRDEALGSFAETKRMCLKESKDVQAFVADNKVAHSEWEKCANSWKEAVEANATIQSQLDESRKMHEETVVHWKAALSSNEDKDKEIARLNTQLYEAVMTNKEIENYWKESNAALARVNGEKAALEKNLNTIQNELNNCRVEAENARNEANMWKNNYDAVMNSTTWRVCRKLKKFIFFWKKI